MTTFATLDPDAVADIFRAAVLKALDEAALEAFAAHGVENLNSGIGATDGDLPELFAAIDAQIDRVADRLGEVVVDKAERGTIGIKFHPFHGFHASAGIAVHFGYCERLESLREEIASHFDAEEEHYRGIDTPADTPSLDTSFHDGEMMA